MFPAIHNNSSPKARKGQRNDPRNRPSNSRVKIRAIIDENGSERSISSQGSKEKEKRSPKNTIRTTVRQPQQKGGQGLQFKKVNQTLQILNRPDIIKQFQVKKQLSVYGSFARHVLDTTEYLPPPKAKSNPSLNTSPRGPPGFRQYGVSKAYGGGGGNTHDVTGGGTTRVAGNEMFTEDYHIRKALVVIFNQQMFDRNGELLNSMKRPGALQDGVELKRLFDEMEFTTRLHTDLKAGEIAHEIYKVVTSGEEHGDYAGNYDCFICCIGSHGNSTRFLGHDCYPVDIAPMLETLNSENCIRFSDKPKLFFINASKTSFDTVKGPITTNARTHYRGLENIGINPSEHAWLSFEVKTTLDASVALMVADDIEAPMIEVTIGASKNRKWVIRTRNMTKEENNFVIEKQIKNYLNEFEYKPFWISWYDKDIKVGYGNEAGKNIKLILKDYQSYISPYRIQFIAIASRDNGNWKFHLPERPERGISLPSQHFFLSYSTLGGTKKYKTQKTTRNSQNASQRTGSHYFQSLVDVFRRTSSDVSLDEIIKQMNKEISHTFVQGQDGIYKKYDKEPITENGLGFRNIYFKTKHYI